MRTGSWWDRSGLQDESPGRASCGSQETDRLGSDQVAGGVRERDEKTRQTDA